MWSKPIFDPAGSWPLWFIESNQGGRGFLNVPKSERMSGQTESKQAFEFWKVAMLVEVTPFRAASLGQLLTGVTFAADFSIFYHLHQRFLGDPARLPEYPNDFAERADRMLGDALVAERLANLNLFRSVDLSVVRREISVILAEHLREERDGRHVTSGREFIFCQPRFIGFGTGLRAGSSREFIELLRQVDSDSISFHLFAPKIVPGPITNDFAAWFRQLGYSSLAQQLDAFDPYLNSLEDNRAYLIELIEAGTRHQPGPDDHD